MASYTMINVEFQEMIRDARINRAKQHGWTVCQWTEDGTCAQLIYSRSNTSPIFTIEIGLALIRQFN